MDDVELALMPDGLANHLVADVILVRGKGGHQTGNTTLFNCCDDIDVIGQEGLAVGHGGHGTGHVVATELITACCRLKPHFLDECFWGYVFSDFFEIPVVGY
ncbi:MAG: hypothetical protein AABZ10_00790 [Nitrospirota bacterium]